MDGPLSNLRIESAQSFPSPRAIKRAYPLGAEHAALVAESRETISNIISGTDRRMLAIVGPCSIHDVEAGCEYAERLRAIKDEMPSLYIVMRVYFEKPRTRLGWRGMLVDPHLNGSNDFHHGIEQARELLLRIASLGIPTGSEFLDPIVPQYIDDLISWASIGARTTESQVHRDMASGLSMPVGFKNSTSGNIEVAINAMVSAMSAKSFLGVDGEGKIAIFRTLGNSSIHLILRGGSKGPNYSESCVKEAEAYCRQYRVPSAIVVDCSHGNSRKDFRNQSAVLRSVVEQRAQGRSSLVGFMLESNLKEGRQDISSGKLAYGVSITDGCMGWDDTLEALQEAEQYAETPVAS